MSQVNILLIEDNELIRQAIKDYAKELQLPWKFEEAGTISEARKKLQQQHFALCISDCHLPDGLACELFSDSLKNIPTLVLSGYLDDEAIKKLKNIHLSVEYYENQYEWKILFMLLV